MKNIFNLILTICLIATIKSQDNSTYKNYTKDELITLIKSNYEVILSDENSFNLKRIINPDKYLNETIQYDLESTLHKSLPITIFMILNDIEDNYKLSLNSTKTLLEELRVDIANHLLADPEDFILVLFYLKERKIIQSASYKMNFSDEDLQQNLKTWSTENGNPFDQNIMPKYIINLADTYYTKSGWKTFQIIFVIIFALFFVGIVLCMVYCFFKMRSDFDNWHNRNDEERRPLFR
jgi:hypothetical protein